MRRYRGTGRFGEVCDVQEKLAGGNRPLPRAINQETGKLVGMDQRTLASKKLLAETPTPATGSERVPSKNGRMEGYASALESSGQRGAIFPEDYPKTRLTKEQRKEVKGTIQSVLWDHPAMAIPRVNGSVFHLGVLQVQCATAE